MPPDAAEQAIVIEIGNILCDIGNVLKNNPGQAIPQANLNGIHAAWSASAQALQAIQPAPARGIPLPGPPQPRPEFVQIRDELKNLRGLIQ